MTDINPATVTESKPWWQSRTYYFNAVCSALFALEASMSLLQPHMPGNVYAWLSVLLIVGNSILRAITTGAISFGSPKAE